MRRAAQMVSVAALAATIVPPVLFFAGRMDIESMKWAMLVAAVAWFAATPIWMNRK